MRPVSHDEVDGASAWLRASAAVLLVLYVLLSVYVLWRSAVLSVFSDEFDWVNSVYGVWGDHRWAAYLLAPHNINRLVWTRLLVAFDMRVLQGTNAPLILSGALALATTTIVLGLQAARAAPRPLKLAAGTLAAMLALMAGNVMDASTPIYVTYTHAAVFAVLALVLSEGAPASPFGWRGAGALLCAMASAFGSGAGLALWPVMAWGALRRRDWRWLATVLAAAGVFVGLYFKGQGHGGGGAALPLHPDLKSALVMTGGFLTLPWTRLSLSFAWMAGWLIAAACGVLVVRNGGRDASPARRIAAGFILFTLGAAAMAGLGRSGLQDPYNVPIRYSLLVAPLQVGLVMLAAPIAGRVWVGRRRLVEAGCVTLLAGFLIYDLAFAKKAVEAGDIIRGTIAEFHAGARTPRMLSIIYPDLAYAERMSLKLQRDGYFRHELHLASRQIPAAAQPAGAR